jgi:hypothetical protein
MLSPSAIQRSDSLVGIETPMVPPAPAAGAVALAVSAGEADSDGDAAPVSVGEAAADVAAGALGVAAASSPSSSLPQAVSPRARMAPAAAVLMSDLRNVVLQ